VRFAVPASCDVLVVGGGVVGTAIAWSLARFELRVVLCEAASDVGQGISRANTAIAHTGFDAPPGSLEAHLVTRASREFPELCARLGVAYRPCGALMIALGDEDLPRLDAYAAKADANGVAVERLGAAELRASHPFLSPEARGGLLIPGEAAVDSFALTIAYAATAAQHGVSLLLDTPVTGIEPRGEDLFVATPQGAIAARYLVNAAGLGADLVARMVGDTSFSLHPRKGQLFVIDPRSAPPIRRILLPTPSPTTKGILITPAVHGNLLLGPTAEDIDDRDDWTTTEHGLALVRAGVRRLIPDFELGQPITQYAGLRSVGSEDDYIVRAATTTPRVLHVAAIRSTGLSASPALGSYVCEQLAALGLELAPRAASREQGQAGTLVAPGARVPARASERRTSAGGDLPDSCIVCVCELVSAGQVRDAIHGPVPARTLDALKRRLWVTAGPCQGTSCLAPLTSLLAEELGIAPEQVRKHAPGSELLVSLPSRSPARRAREPQGEGLLARYDVVVVGAGPSGLAAAEAAQAHGATVLLVEMAGFVGGALAAMGLADSPPGGASPSARSEPRRDLALGTALAAVRAGLELELRGPASTRSVRAGALVLATGAREQTRGNLQIPGSRPAGVLTAGTALRLLAATGQAPGRRALIVGTGRWAERCAEVLGAAGVEIAALVPAIAGLEGWPRVSAALLLAGERLRCDAIVLATPTLPWLPPPFGHALEMPGVFRAGAGRLGEVDCATAGEDGAAIGIAAASWVLA
jgi:glycerol-3-phosphate dehydrogenase